jgi:hypothetical protein
MQMRVTHGRRNVTPAPALAIDEPRSAVVGQLPNASALVDSAVGICGNDVAVSVSAVSRRLGPLTPGTRKMLRHVQSSNGARPYSQVNLSQIDLRISLPCALRSRAPGGTSESLANPRHLNQLASPPSGTR